MISKRKFPLSFRHVTEMKWQVEQRRCQATRMKLLMYLSGDRSNRFPIGCFLELADVDLLAWTPWWVARQESREQEITSEKWKLFPGVCAEKYFKIQHSRSSLGSTICRVHVSNGLNRAGNASLEVNDS